MRRPGWNLAVLDKPPSSPVPSAVSVSPDRPLPEKWFPDHQNGSITPHAQALLYPYPAPDGDFWMRDGLPWPVPQGIAGEALVGRVPVLSVGSNRAPLQLRRKFGTDATIPVTAAMLHDCDIVFAASIAPYGAIPATAHPHQGVRVRLNIAWLAAAQLQHMHATEALGIAYDFIRYDASAVSHVAVPASRDHDVFCQPVFGYQARNGALALDGVLTAQAGIATCGRKLATADQKTMLDRLRRHFRGLGDAAERLPLNNWLSRIVTDRAARLALQAELAEYAIQPVKPPWQKEQVVSADAADFL